MAWIQSYDSYNSACFLSESNHQEVAGETLQWRFITGCPAETNSVSTSLASALHAILWCSCNGHGVLHAKESLGDELGLVWWVGLLLCFCRVLCFFLRLAEYAPQNWFCAMVCLCLGLFWKHWGPGTARNLTLPLSSSEVSSLLRMIGI